MTIQKQKTDTSIVLTLSGRLDTTTSPELEKELEDAMSTVHDVTIDLKDVEYVSSAGLRVLLAAQKTMEGRGKIKLIHVSGMVMEVFRVTGFTKLLTIE